MLTAAPSTPSRSRTYRWLAPCPSGNSRWYRRVEFRQVALLHGYRFRVRLNHDGPHSSKIRCASQRC